MVTGEQVHDAMTKADITSVDVRDCSMCGYQMRYVRRGGDLFYDTGCDCTYQRGGLEPRTFDDVANWINMQSNPTSQAKIAGLFGLQLESV